MVKNIDVDLSTLGNVTPQEVDFNGMMESFCEITSNRIMRGFIYRGPRKYNSKSKENLLQNKEVTEEQKKEYCELMGIKYVEHETPISPYNGLMSPATRKRVSKFLDTWVNSMVYHNNNPKIKRDLKKYNLVFFTLTLSSKQIHSDNEIKRKIFNRFIEYCKEKKYFENYFWRAEKQKNGNIHFHMIVDKYLPLDEVKKLWNKYQNRLGYIDRYQQQQKEKYPNGFRPLTIYEYNKKVQKKQLVPINKQLERYNKAKKDDFKNPNSIDLRKLNYKKNIISYLLKYMTKSVKKFKDETTKQFEKRKQLEKVDGRIWGCSDKIRKILPYTTDNGNSNLNSLINYCNTDKSVRSYYPDEINYVLYYFKGRKVLNYFLKKFDIYKDFEKYQRAILYWLYNIPEYGDQYAKNYADAMTW